jgi:hypothetical protein
MLLTGKRNLKKTITFRCKESSKSNTKWISRGLFDEDGKITDYTADHPFTARITMRIIMSDWPSFMDNFDEYVEVINFFSQTVGISKKENQDVKVIKGENGEIKIGQLTKDKYADFTFVNRDTGEIKEGLPFEIPEWFEKGEKERLLSNKEILFKKLKKMKKEGVQGEANLLGINTKNVNGNVKNKSELINDIINM